MKYCRHAKKNFIIFFGLLLSTSVSFAVRADSSGSKNYNECMLAAIKKLSSNHDALAACDGLKPENLKSQELEINLAENRLKGAGCWRYEEEPVNSKFLQCFRFDLTNIDSGKIVYFDQTPRSIIGCAKNLDSKWCKVYLINKKRYPVLGYNFDLLFGGNLPPERIIGMYLFVENIGEPCNCKVSTWAIESGRSLFLTWGNEDESKADSLMKMIMGGNSLSIYAVTPTKFEDDFERNKRHYRVKFEASDMLNFVMHMREADQFTKK